MLKICTYFAQAPEVKVKFVVFYLEKSCICTTREQEPVVSMGRVIHSMVDFL